MAWTPKLKLCSFPLLMAMDNCCHRYCEAFRSTVAHTKLRPRSARKLWDWGPHTPEVSIVTGIKIWLCSRKLYFDLFLLSAKAATPNLVHSWLVSGFWVNHSSIKITCVRLTNGRAKAQFTQCMSSSNCRPKEDTGRGPWFLTRGSKQTSLMYRMSAILKEGIG